MPEQRIRGIVMFPSQFFLVFLQSQTETVMANTGYSEFGYNEFLVWRTIMSIKIAKRINCNFIGGRAKLILLSIIFISYTFGLLPHYERVSFVCAAFIISCLMLRHWFLPIMQMFSTVETVSQYYCGCIYAGLKRYIYKTAEIFVCLSVPPFFSRHDRRTATKFGPHIRVDMGLILS